MLRPETIYHLHRAATARYRCQQTRGFPGLMQSVRWWAAIELDIRHVIETTEEEVVAWRLFLANVGDLHCEPMRRLGQSILALALIEQLDLYHATAHALAGAAADT